jgi:hypothetical protein
MNAEVPSACAVAAAVKDWKLAAVECDVQRCKAKAKSARKMEN